MLAEAVEIAEMGERANDLEVALRGHFRRTALLLELGNTPAAAAAADRMSRINARLRQPHFLLFELGVKATISLLRGDLAEAEQLILRILGTSLPYQPHATSGDPVSLLIFTLRREQDRLRGLGAVVATFMQQQAGTPPWGPGLALMYVEIGDLRSASGVLAELAAHDFGSLPCDRTIGDKPCCSLRRCARRSATQPSRRHSIGFCSLGRGITSSWAEAPAAGVRVAASWVCWRRPRAIGCDAELHFAEALAMNERAGALAPLAHTHCDVADMLLARGQAWRQPPGHPPHLPRRPRSVRRPRPDRSRGKGRHIRRERLAAPPC